MNTMLAPDFKLLFQTVPGLYLILLPDLTIVEVSDAYLKATMTKRADVLGHALFELFPDNPNDTGATGVSNLRASLNYVLRTGKAHTMAIQKYDIRRQDGVFEERFWSLENSPVFDEEQELIYIIHKVEDVTAKQRSEEHSRSLLEQIDHLAAIVEQSSEAIISSGIDQRVISWNRGAEILFGYTKEQAIGKTAWELGMIKLTEQETENIGLLVLEKGSWNSEMRFYHKDGSSFTGTVTANAVKNKQGAISSIVFIINDISLRKQLEDHLKQHNEELEEKVTARTEEITKRKNLFRTLIENSNDIISLMDDSFKLIYRSPAAARITGWTNEDMLSIEATKNIHPGDQAYAADIVKEVMANPAKRINTKFRMRHKDGYYLWIEGTLTNLLHDNYIRAIVFNFRDVTERMEAEVKLTASEKQFRSTLDNMLEGIQIHDQNWRYVYANDALVKYSRTTRKELIGHTLMEKYPGIEQTDLFRVLDRCMKEQVAEQFETEFVFPDGNRADFQLSIQPNPEGLLILSFDITKRRKAERALRKEQDKFTRIVNASPGLIYSFRRRSDGHLSFPFASHAFEEIFGVTYEMAADNVNLIIDSSLQQDKELLLSSIASSAMNMSPWQLQFRYNHPIKGIVWLEGHSIPTTETDGSILWHGVITDVTERKLTEDKINEQNLRLKTLSDNLPGMMLYQLTGDTYENRKFSYVSNGVTQLTNKTPEEILNDPSALYNLVTEEDARGMIAAEMQSYKTMTPFNVEVRCRDYKGDIRWLNIISTPRKLKNDQVVWDGLQLDITDKKLAEHQKEFDQNNLNALINNTHDLMWSVDRNFNLITSNEAFDKLVYILSGKKLKHGDPVLLPEFNERQLERYKNYYLRAFDGETFTEVEHDGSMEDFWSEISFYPMYEAGAVIGTACFSRNITKQRKAEQELEQNYQEKKVLVDRLSVILNTLPANIALLNADGVIIDVNEAWKQFACENNYTGDHYGLGSNYISIAEHSFGPDKKEGKLVARSIKAILKKELKEFVFEYPCHSPEKKRWFRMVATPLEGKGYSGAVIMHIDISELRRLEDERLQSKTEEQQKITRAMLSAQEKERHNIGIELHDNVNQILAGTKLFLQMIKSKPEMMQKYLTICMENLSNAIDENRKIAHVFVSPARSENLLDQLKRLTATMLKISGIKVKFSSTTYEEDRLGQEKKINIYRIAQEQCTNIVKYAKATTAELSLAMKDDTFTLTIKDNGIGMDSAVTKGGIGLKNIADRLSLFNGTSKITTAPGKGFCLEIAVPL
ncbi:MAG: PAS domain S-box protein [Chitinophagaceae bacterium]